MQWQMNMSYHRNMICRRFYDIFTKLSAISIDGFKRERYVIKIQHLTDEIVKAQNDLNAKEKQVESGAFQQLGAESLSDAIQSITDLMLKIETLSEDKISMQKTLKAKEQKWI